MMPTHRLFDELVNHIVVNEVARKGERITARIADSIVFLKNYWEMLHSTPHVVSDVNGKLPMHEIPEPNTRNLEIVASSWAMPPARVIKINTDASFLTV